MSLLAWIVLGLVAGFIGSKLVNKAGEGILLDIVLGIVGAVAGGFLFNAFGPQGVTGLNVYSLCAAGVGSVVLLVAYYRFPTCSLSRMGQPDPECSAVGRVTKGP